MLEQSQPLLNRLAFVGYYLDTRVDVWPHSRINIADALKRRVDMDVSGMGSVHGSGPVRSAVPAAASGLAQPTAPNAAQSPLKSSQDELEISAAGHMLDRLSETPELRAERIAQIKEAIENGDYDTDEKLEAALARMFEVHGFDLDD
ncbi:MAG: flagellar biosynthesis anti-sigma factor FlgM [Planctomycetes bacterium]|nr:flagellar biosynthesis anti-sigma factor FlgM [Planctomycetota bacterium]